MDRPQNEKEEVKMGARVNLWVLVFALVLISSTWYISELPDRIYISQTEPQPVSAEFQTGVQVQNFTEWLAEAGNYTDEWEYWDAHESGDIWAKSLGTDNDKVLVYTGSNYYIPVTYNSVDIFETETHSSLASDPTSIECTYGIAISTILSSEYYFFSFYICSPNVDTAQSTTLYYYIYTSDGTSLTLLFTASIDSAAVQSGVWYHHTYTTDELQTLANYATGYPHIKIRNTGRIAKATDSVTFCALFKKPAEGGVYETENGETVVVHDNTIWNHLNILKVSAGLVGAMCILAAVASTPLWNPTRAWRRRRRRRW